MQLFGPPHPMHGSAPQKFRVSMYGNGVTMLAGSFADVVHEHEIDAIITTLLALRPLLRENRIAPLPRNRSLQPLPTPDRRSE